MVQLTEWGAIYIIDGIIQIEVKGLNKTYTPKDHEALRYYRGIAKKLLDASNRPDSFKDGLWFKLAYSFSIEA